MPQVPYSPVPDVAPRQTPVGPIRVDANPNMFGAAVGAALSQAGQVTEAASNEVYARGMAMQQMKNEADANAAVANYDAQAAQLHAKFSSLTGANAGPEALAAHTQALQDLRTQIGSTLTNPAAQQMYNNPSLQMLGRSIFNAAGHSAEQTKVYYEQGLQAKIQNSVDSAQRNPTDDLSFKASLDQIPTDVHNLALSQGWPPDVEQEHVATATSRLYSNRITELSRQNPLAGAKMLDDAIKSGQLRGQDVGPTQRIVDQQTTLNGSKQIADGLNDGSSMQLGKGQVPIQRAADAIAQIESGGAGYATVGRTMVTSGPYAGQRALGRYGIMPGNLPQWLAQAGLPAITPEQFLANPQAQDKVFATQWPKLVQKYGSANAAAAYWLGGDAAAKGESNRPDGNGVTPSSYVRAFNANLAKITPTDEKVAAAQRQAGEIAPQLALLPDYAKQRVITQDAETQRAATAAARQTQQVFDSALAHVQGSGATPGGFDAWVNSNPQLAQAWKALDQSKDGKAQLAIQNAYRTALSSDNVSSQERDARRQSLIGMAQNDPETFLDKNLYETDLTANDRKLLVQQRDKMISGATGDPHLAVALGIMQTQMNAAGLNRKDDKDTYDTFTGAMADQLRAFQTAHQRQPNANEIKDIGNRLLTSQVTETGMFRNSQVPLFQATPPQSYIDSMKSKFPTASDEQIRQRYVRDQYRIAVGKDANAQH